MSITTPDATGIHEGTIRRRDRANVSSWSATSSRPVGGRFGESHLLGGSDFGVLLIGMTYRFGELSSETPSPEAGRPFVLALSPTFLYQAVQPMSDVPGAACWLAALVVASYGIARAFGGLAGALSSLAILIRPNLAPLALSLLSLRSHRGTPRAPRALFTWQPSRRVWWCSAGFKRFVMGHPSRRDMARPGRRAFRSRMSCQTLRRYPRWMTESHTPFIWLSLLAPFWIVPTREDRLLVWTALGLSTAVWTRYLPYVYLSAERMVLHPLPSASHPLMLFFAAAAALAGVRRCRRCGGHPRQTAMLGVDWGGVAAPLRRRTASSTSGIRNASIRSRASSCARRGPGQRVRARRSAQRQHPLLREPADSPMGSDLADAAGPGARDISGARV